MTTHARCSDDDRELLAEPRSPRARPAARSAGLGAASALVSGMRAHALWASISVACTGAGEPIEPAERSVVEAPELAASLERLREGHTVIRVPLTAARELVPRTGDRVWLRFDPPREREEAIARGLLVVGLDARSVQLAAPHAVARCVVEATAAATPLVLSLMQHDEGPEQCPAAPDTDVIPPAERTRAPER